MNETQRRARLRDVISPEYDGGVPGGRLARNSSLINLDLQEIASEKVPWKVRLSGMELISGEASPGTGQSREDLVEGRLSLAESYCYL